MEGFERIGLLVTKHIFDIILDDVFEYVDFTVARSGLLHAHLAVLLHLNQALKSLQINGSALIYGVHDLRQQSFRVL